MNYIYLLTTSCLLACGNVNGQVSFSVSPSKIYFQVPYQEIAEQTITVQNNGKEKRSYTISFMSWDRNESGEKHFSPDTGQIYSCARMLNAQPEVFNLSPGEKQAVNVTLAHKPRQKLPALWAMLMIRELKTANRLQPGQGVRATINVEYQIGVHVYQQLTDSIAKGPELELDTMILSEQAGVKEINVHLNNKSKRIAEGQLRVQLFSMDSNAETTLPVRSLSLLPEHKRIIRISLPDDLKPGDYTITAAFDPGNENDLLIGDFYFNIPPD